MSIQERRLQRFTRLVAQATDRWLNIRLIGTEHVKQARKPVIFAANHRSLADLWVGLTVFHRLGIYPGILFNRRFLPGPLAPFAAGAGVILVAKGGAVNAGIGALQAGRSLMVMPEGRLHFDPAAPSEPGTFRSGMAVMAHEAQVPIVPVAVDGTEKAWPPGHGPRRPRRPKTDVSVSFGVPIRTEGDPEADASAVRASVAALLRDAPTGSPSPLQ